MLIEGRLIPDSGTGGPRIWQRQDGSSAASFEVSASTIRFLSARGEEETSFAPGETAEPAGEEDIPF